MLLIVVPLIVVFAFFIIGLISWLASSSLRVRDARPQPPLHILSVTEETITFPRLPKTIAGGVSGITWPEGQAVIDEIVDMSSRTVTRRILTSEGLSVGLPVHWNRFVYRGNPQHALGLAYEEVRIPGPLGELPAWFIPGKLETWVLLIHGRRGTREESLRVLPAIAELGFPALVMTYRNDAGAPQTPDHMYHLGDTEWEDVEAGVRYALSHGAQDVVLFGWSMGGSLVETFLRRSPEASYVRAIVLDSPALNWRKVLDAQAHRLHLPHWLTYVIAWMVTWRVGIDFATLNYERPAHEPPIPTLLFHGTADIQVPIASSDLFAQARPTFVTYQRVEGVDHTLIWNADPTAYEDTLKTFLQRVPQPEVSREVE